MNTSLGLLGYLESKGVQLRTDGQGIRFRAPEGVLNDSLKGLVRDHKSELVKMLEARRGFGYRGAALFPLIGRGVVTSQGPGEIQAVFRRYCRVQLRGTDVVVLHDPLALIALAVSDFTEELAA